MTDTRLPRPDRAAHQRDTSREAILSAAMTLAEREGYRNATRDQIAKEAGAAAGLVNFYFKTMEGLRNAIMQEAVATNCLPIVAQGLADKHPLACSAPAPIREAAVRALA